jgi:hypothetical protein
MDRYLGEPYGDEETDRSQVVSMDVADVVDSILPDLMEIFFGGDQVVKFDPEGPEDIQAAEQETDVLNYIVQQQLDGFLLHYEWFKDALLQRNGYVKWWWEVKKDTRTERYFGLAQDGIDALLEKFKNDGEEAEIAAQTPCDYEQEESSPETEQAMGMQPPGPGMAQQPGMQPPPPDMSQMMGQAPSMPPQMGMQPMLMQPMQPPQMGQPPPDDLRAQWAGITAQFPQQFPPPEQPPEAEPQPPQETWDVVLRVTSKPRGRPRAVVIPPDEALVPARWSSVFLDEAPYFIHRPRGVTESDLIAQGYDRDQVQALPTMGTADDSERAERFGAEVDDPRAAATQATREIDIVEWYGRADRDGDGIAELRKVTAGGPGWEILKWGKDAPDGREPGDEDDEEVDEIPVAALTPVIMPHRHFGVSPADQAKPYARQRTVLRRQMLDNIYLSNFPMVELPEAAIGDNTIDDLLNPKPRGIVRTAAPGMMNALAPPTLIQQSLEADQQLVSDLQNRTGVTKYDQGLDASSLNKTATGVSRIMDASQKKKLLIARSFAETGVKRFFLGLHGLMQRHCIKPLSVRLRNTWVEVDPREWKSRYDMQVSVGLGTGNKDQELAHLMTIWQGQQTLMQHPNPAFAGMVTPKNVFNTAEQICAKAGLKTAAPYFTDPDEIPPQQPQRDQPPPPDPRLIQVQQSGQLDQAKAQHEAQLKERQQMASEQQQSQQLEIQREKIRADFVLGLIDIQSKTGIQLDIAKIDAAVESGRISADVFQGLVHKGADLAHAATQAEQDRALQMHQGMTQQAFDAAGADAQQQHDAEQADLQRQHDAEQADAARAMQAQAEQPGAGAA